MFLLIVIHFIRSFFLFVIVGSRVLYHFVALVMSLNHTIGPLFNALVEPPISTGIQYKTGPLVPSWAHLSLKFMESIVPNTLLLSISFLFPIFLFWVKEESVIGVGTVFIELDHPIKELHFMMLWVLYWEPFFFAGVQPEEFFEDLQVWRVALKNYWSLLTPLIFSDHPKRPGDEDPLPPFNMIRNVMDMNANYGGLNAAFLEERKSVWVMNVVPVRSPNMLPLVLDQGFAGVLHDW